MMELLNIGGGQNQKISSREIAEITGKEHRSVLRDIDNLNDSYAKLDLHKVVQTSYRDSSNREQREFQLSKIQSMDLITTETTSLSGRRMKMFM